MSIPPRPILLKAVRKPLQAIGSAGAGLLLWGALSGIVSDPVARVEGILSDFRNQAWMVFYGPTPEDQPSPVTVVDVDERTLQELGLYGESYRRHHAKVVETLSRDGAGAVVFDVLFKESSASRTQLAEIEAALARAGIAVPADSTSRERLRRAVDVSTLLEDAVARSGRTIVAAQLGDHLEYPNPSDWIPLVRRQWQESVWNSGVRLPPAALGTLRGRNTLDNIYPALARGAERLALANIEPDVDGSVRRIQMLWRYPDTSFRDPVLAPEGTAIPMAYPSLSLATTMAMFGRRSEEAVYVPGKWIDLGAPLRVWKDSSGLMRVSAPEVTWPMLEDLRSRRSGLDSLVRARSGTLSISAEIVLHRRANGQFSVALAYPDSLDDAMVRALAPLGGDTTWWSELPADGSPAALSDLVTVRRDPEGFHLATLHAAGDLENPPRSEVSASPRQLRILGEGLQDLASRVPSLDAIPAPTRIAFSNALDVHWDRTRGRLGSVYLALRGSSIEGLLALEPARIEAMRPGDTLFLGDPVRIPVDSRGSALLSFAAPARWVARRTDESWLRHVSYVDVLNGRLDPGLVPGRVFVLGSSAIALADFVDTPIEQRHPGVNVQSLGIHLWSSGDVLRLLPPWVETVAPIAMALAAGTAAAFLAPAWALFGTFALLLAWFAGTVVLFQEGWWAPLLGVFAPVFLTTVLMAALRYVLEEREKKFLHRSFSSYLSPHLIEQMIDSGDLPKLGGEEREITAFFSDIQAFSTFSEAIGSPARLVELLNEYLNALTHILESNGGMLDKYIGDAIVGMYGAPLRLEDHARRAVETAVAMQERLAILRSGWQNQGEAWPEIVHHMRTRIGLNTGLAVTGNMGSHLRMNYTMMGDTVNLAARLESGAKHYGAFVLATDSTVSRAGSGFLFRELDAVRVVGRNEPVLIHEVVGRSGDSRWDACLEHFSRGRASYLSGDFHAARDAFQSSLLHEPFRGQPGVKRTPSDTFLERCEAYIAKPPAHWDGIHTATEK